jgi:ATP-dependent RNA helicase RhlE
MRNARGRMNRGEAQARADKSRGKSGHGKPARENKQRTDDARGLKQENARGSKFEQMRKDPRLCEGDESRNGQTNGRKPGSNGQDGDARRHRRRNRPGSRARRRMRENGGAV